MVALSGWRVKRAASKAARVHRVDTFADRGLRRRSEAFRLWRFGIDFGVSMRRVGAGCLCCGKSAKLL